MTGTVGPAVGFAGSAGKPDGLTIPMTAFAGFCWDFEEEAFSGHLHTDVDGSKCSI